MGFILSGSPADLIPSVEALPRATIQCRSTKRWIVGEIAHDSEAYARGKSYADGGWANIHCGLLMLQFSYEIARRVNKGAVRSREKDLWGFRDSHPVCIIISPYEIDRLL